MKTFAELMAEVQPGEQAGRYIGELHEEWLQGRSTFGGLTAALAVQALRLELGYERPLRALMTAFVGPAGEGEVEIDCASLRSGKSVTWAEAKLCQNDQVAATVAACFGGNRESTITVEAPRRPNVKGPAESQAFPFLPGITPNFTQHYEMRYAAGQMPMTASKHSAMGVWLRYKQPDNFSEAHIVALMDVLPPAVLQMFKEMKPISSLTWHLEFLDDLTATDAQDSEGWWFFDVHAHGAANGYSQQHATLYTPAGRALAMSQQQIAVFG